LIAIINFIILAALTLTQMNIQAIKEEVTVPSKAEQAELMHFMIELLATDNFQLSDEWKEELEQRETALENGTSVGKSAREVLAKYTK
jgi:predicted Holliday junction resolvase-like endonuclease